MSFKPAVPYITPARILKSEYKMVNGIETKVFTEGSQIYVSARSYGGTKTFVNDELVILNTLVIETWYTPEITGKDAIRLLDDDSVWELMQEPDNIDRRNQYLKFRVQRYEGNA